MTPGRAYNPQRGGYVTFPFVPTLRLPTSSLLCRPDLRISAGEETLLLTADAEADGLGEDDLPDDLPDGTRYTAQITPSPVRRYTGIVYRVPSEDKPLVDYDEDLHRRLWDALRTGSSLKGAQEKARMGYTGGTGFYLARAVRELGQRHSLPWENA